MITLTRVFSLTHDHQSLLREITTPSIPPFVTSCLNIISQRRSDQETHKLDFATPLLNTVLQVLAKLIPNHPSSFRPFVRTIRSLLNQCLTPTPSNLSNDGEDLVCTTNLSGPTTVLAQHLYSLLPICAPKNTSNEEWANIVKTIIDHVHGTADHVLRAVFEDWESPSRTRQNVASAIPYAGTVGQGTDNALDLPSWSGIDAGCERLNWLLQLLRSHLSVKSSCAYSLPVGAVLSVLERLLHVTVPFTVSQQTSGYQARFNPEIGREEREGLWLSLPVVHVSAIAVMSALIARLDDASFGITKGALDQVLWVLEHEQDHSDLRNTAYAIIAQILSLTGPAMSRASVTSFSPLIRMLCRDILPAPNLENTAKSGAGPSKTTSSTGTNADSYLKPQNAASIVQCQDQEVSENAAILFTVIMSRLPMEHLSVPVRSLLDRTAILTGNRGAMLASVLNPESRTKSNQLRSILPFLARVSTSSLEFEAVLRPRMPTVQTMRNERGDHTEDEEEDQEIDEHTQEEGVRFGAPPANASMGETGIEEESGVGEPSVNIFRPASYTEQALAEPKMDISGTGKDRPAGAVESSKRSREDVDAGITSTASIPEKRMRMNNNATSILQPPELSSLIPEYVSSIEPVAPVVAESSVSPADHTAMTDARTDLEDDSDGSFEIPPIILGLDSDEEEAEGVGDE